ncbi:MAG: glycosyltransferase, partial [Planctomycetota bacterium]
MNADQAMQRVTIVTPTLNAGRHLDACIASVRACGEELAADGLDVRHVVIDAGSTDNSLEVVASRQAGLDAGQLELHAEPGIGRAAALNRGMQLAGGGLVGWLDADDVYQP